MRSHGRLQRPQAHREIWPQGKYDEMEGTPQRRLPQARCTQPERALRLNMSRFAEGVIEKQFRLATETVMRYVHLIRNAPSSRSSWKPYLVVREEFKSY